MVAIAEHNYNFVFEFNAIDEANFIYFGHNADALAPFQKFELKVHSKPITPDLAVVSYGSNTEAEKPIDVRLELWYQIQKSRFYQFQKYLNARRSLSLPPAMIC